MKYEPYTIEDVKKSAERKLFTVISTFAGGGGSSTGYKLAGGDILCVNEFVESAQETYLANYPGTPFVDGDINYWTLCLVPIARDVLSLGWKYAGIFKRRNSNNLYKKTILKVCSKNPTWISETSTALSAIEKMNFKEKHEMR